MKHTPLQGCQFFFTTTPLPCPYLDDRMERRVVTELVGRGANDLHDILSLSGFRRSHGIAYAPACPDCNACEAVRIDVAGFVPGRSLRRVLNRNADLHGTECPPEATDDQYALFSLYIHSRHGDGDMANMVQGDYRALVEDTPVDSTLLEFRDGDGILVAGCLCDRLSDGLSAVYSFFDPTQDRRSLGTYMVLWMIERARQLDLPYVYLGYWIAESPKMAYKARFQPLETFRNGAWERFPPHHKGA